MVAPKELVSIYGGFHGGTPLARSLDGLFHGKSQSKMDDLGGTPMT
jgi:hypothetical protein